MLRAAGESAQTTADILLKFGAFFGTQILQPQSQEGQHVSPLATSKNTEDNSQIAFKVKINSGKYHPLILKINR